MKILIINYYYPPIGRAHSYRWEELSQYWASRGHDVSFITSRSEEERGNEKVNLIEIGTQVSKDRFNTNAIKHGQSSIKARLTSLIKIVYRKLYWPDGLWYWFFPLFTKLYKMRKQKYDCLITYSPTFVSHLGGLFFKKISNKGVYWIADYGDPFSISDSMQPNNFKLYRKLNYFFENKVLVNADNSVFTNEMTRTAYEDKFKGFRSEIIPHAVDIDKFYAGDKKINLKNIQIVYVGSFHKDIREPHKATKFIRDLIQVATQHDMDFNFDVYGPNNGIEVSGLESECVKFYGPIAREEAIEKIKYADLLVNIENQNCVMSPSKIVEYLATGNPIINFYHDKPSELFLNQRSILNIQLNNMSVNEAFNSVVGMLEIGLEDKCVVNNKLKMFAIEYIGKKFLE